LARNNLLLSLSGFLQTFRAERPPLLAPLGMGVSVGYMENKNASVGYFLTFDFRKKASLNRGGLKLAKKNF
jgi:hypothetical protein